MKKLLPLACAAFCLVPSLAAAGWQSGKVLELTSFLDGGVIVKIDAVHECGSDLVSFDATTGPGFDRVYSSILTSQVADAQVDFSIQSCSGTTAIIDRVVGH